MTAFAQSYRCDRVIVVDNCSTDGTTEMLRQEWGNRVDVRTLSRNIGASGGFNAGVKIAYQTGADFVWMMDDDVLPTRMRLPSWSRPTSSWPTAVSSALFLSSAWTDDGSVTNVPRIDTRPGARGYETWPGFVQRKMVPVTRATFVSILLPRSVIAEHGLPLAPMFIWGEELPDPPFASRVEAPASSWRRARCSICGS